MPSTTLETTGSASNLSQGTTDPSSAATEETSTVPGPLDSCEIDQVFCVITDRCQSPADACGVVCPPSHVVCSGQETCVTYRACQDPLDTGLAWTLPEPVVQGSSELPPAVSLNSIVQSAAAETLLLTGNAPSFLVETADEGWEAADAADGTFSPLTVGSRLRFSQFVQFQPADTGFGLRQLNLSQDVDKETSLQYTVLQYVLPRAGLVSINTSELTLAEDEPGTLLISELVSVGRAASAADLEELSWQLQSPALDRAALGYQQLRSLYQPTVPVRVRYAGEIQRRSEVPGQTLFSYTGDEDR
ncbi:uncharacterized protein LOC119098231 [Pollicipes pollicipes]|uniref:uncharacterized protein LOC119098231 n=1 Tax=Pollicipes pollicipes TaxID=41117 RepID=UPI001884A21F|nr:uncharacterized protein LOC119098231 [Pollicipes pollicipes]